MTKGKARLGTIHDAIVATGRTERTLRKWLSSGKLRKHWQEGKLFVDLDAAMALAAANDAKDPARAVRGAA